MHVLEAMREFFMRQSKQPSITQRSLFLYFLIFSSAFASCSLRRMALDQTASILKGAMPAFEKDWDVELVGAALPANIKIIEGFLQSGPQNQDLLLMAAQAYASYALVILEEQLEKTEEDTPQADHLSRRIREMYLRAYRYAARLLEVRHAKMSNKLAKGAAAAQPILAQCTKQDVPGLFWGGMALASAINVARDDVQLIAQMPLARKMISRVLELDETYQNAGGHMILGAMLGSVGKMLGGNPELAQKHFETALKLTQRKFLLVHLLYAKTVAVQLQDQKLFQSLLSEVQNAKLDIFPEQKLANMSAKRRARLLLARQGSLF